MRNDLGVEHGLDGVVGVLNARFWVDVLAPQAPSKWLV